MDPNNNNNNNKNNKKRLEKREGKHVELVRNGFVLDGFISSVLVDLCAPILARVCFSLMKLMGFGRILDEFAILSTIM